jgi:uncharacterized RDD family membrane protein YckC/type II secretory pathway pseudopilin PulG
MEIRIHRDGSDFGPYSLEELRQYLASGQIIPTDLAWYQGAPDWMPVTQVPGLNPQPVAPPMAAPQMPPAMPPMGPPGMPPMGATPAMPAMPPMMGMPSMPMGGSGYVTYAGFWKRVAAYIGDYIVLGIVGSLIGGAMLGSVIKTNDPQKVLAASLGFYALMIPLVVLYFTVMESGAGQATFGKRMVGIVVTDLNGQRISFLKALGRLLGKIVSGAIFYVGFMMAGFTEKKQGLHDIMAGTLVVNKDPNQTGLGGCAVLLLVGLPVGAILLGIVAAIAIPAYVNSLRTAAVSAAITNARPLQDTVATYTLANRQLPSSLGDLNMVSPPTGPGLDYQVNDGTILISFAIYNFTPPVIGQVALEPYYKGNEIVWRCGKAAAPAGAQDVSTDDSANSTTLDNALLPAGCR